MTVSLTRYILYPSFDMFLFVSVLPVQIFILKVISRLIGGAGKHFSVNPQKNEKSQRILTALPSITTYACHATSWPVCDFSLLVSKGLIDPFVSVTVLLLFQEYAVFYLHNLCTFLFTSNCLFIYSCCSASL
jgi:hypothetical protein